MGCSRPPRLAMGVVEPAVGEAGSGCAGGGLSWLSFRVWETSQARALVNARCLSARWCRMSHLPRVDALLAREDLPAYTLRYESGRNVSAYRYSGR